MQQTRRDFIRTIGTLSIGFCLTGESAIWPSPTQSLPGDLRENPRINAWLEILADGHVRVLTGKIELGQGIRTAVAQMAAEELDLDMSQVDVLLAETGRTPDEGYTAGSNSIEGSAIAIRYAAAAARQKLLQLAAQKWNTPIDHLGFSKGIITDKANHRSATLAEILGNQQISDEVRMPVALKQKDKYQYVGKAIPRDDVKRITLGLPVYVHDLDFPGMLHARVVHPPAYGAALNPFDQQVLKNKLPNTTIILNGSFLAVLAPTEYAAIKAHQIVQKSVNWSTPKNLPDIQPADLPAYLRTLPVTTERVAEKGDISPLTQNATVKASYFKPYIMHGAIGPSCAVAHYEGGKLDIWTHSQGVYPLRETIAAFLHLSVDDIHVKGTPGSGCYGHNGADDAAAEAALLAVANPGKHIRLQWSREDEHGWEPYGSAMLMDLEAIVQPSGKITHWKYALHSDTHGTRPGGNPANLLPAHYIENPIPQKPSGFSGGANRNSEPYYAIPNQLVEAHFFEGPLRTSSLRSLGAYANLYAIESFMDELANHAGIDPIEFRLKNLDDPRAIAVLLLLQKQLPTQALQNRSNTAITSPTGVGIAFSRYKNSGCYCAVAAQIVIDKTTGTPAVKKMWAVVDAGEVINLDGVKNQIEGGMIQSASWTLYEQVLFSKDHITSRAWSAYPVMHMPQAPEVSVTVIDRPDQHPFGAGEAAQGPAAAAILNAIHNACGQRIRTLPVGKIQPPSPTPRQG
jgi:CO/xanthine dehydrogenase Mo-binding subunit